MRRWTCIQHVPYEGPAGWEDTLAEFEFALDISRVDLGDAVPDPDDPDLAGLLVMGGPMHALDDGVHPWLIGERALLAAAHARSTPIIGVCLGSQLVVAALGGAVSRGGHSELGIGPIDWTPHALRILGDDLPEQVLHWHDDGATPIVGTRLAQTSITHWQATATPSSVALQFHIEIRPQDLSTITPHLPVGMTIDHIAVAAYQQEWSNLRRRILMYLASRSKPVAENAPLVGDRVSVKTWGESAP